MASGRFIFHAQRRVARRFPASFRPEFRGKPPIAAFFIRFEQRGRMSTVISLRQPPFGLLELDGAGVVRNYAPIKGQPPLVSARQVIGKDFFSEILPSEQVRGFQRVFKYFMEHAGETQRMAFPVTFDGSTVEIQVMMACLGGQAEGAKRKMALVKIKPGGSSSQHE